MLSPIPTRGLINLYRPVPKNHPVIRVVQRGTLKVATPKSVPKTALQVGVGCLDATTLRERLNVYKLVLMRIQAHVTRVTMVTNPIKQTPTVMYVTRVITAKTGSVRRVLPVLIRPKLDKPRPLPVHPVAVRIVIVRLGRLNTEEK